MKTTERPMTDKEEAIIALRKIFRPGDTVYTILRHVSKSGMMRRIDVVSLKGGDPRTWTILVARACDYGLSKNGRGLVTHGCGMDMGFEVVYNLGRALWPGGNGKFSRGRNGDKGPETEGGYMLRQEWL